jgi:hypothetical protein
MHQEINSQSGLLFSFFIHAAFNSQVFINKGNAAVIILLGCE